MKQETTQRGFTLIELMISLVLFSFAVAGLLSIGVAVTQGYAEQRRALAAESAVRVPLDFLADALRQASPGVSTPANLQDSGTCNTGAINVIDSSSGSDELYLMYAAGAVVTSTREIYDNTSQNIDVTNASQFADDDAVIISNFTNGTLLHVDTVDTSANTLTFASPCSGLTVPSAGSVAGYPVGSLVIRAQYAHFYIADLDGIPTLWMDPDAAGTAFQPEPLAEGIEDMQIAVGIDGDSDGSISENGLGAGDDEWWFNFAGEAMPSTGSIRAVRITLVARATKPLVGNAPLYYRPGAENRIGSTAPDAYRRRVLRTIVDMRNIGGSP
ncbi:MAG TPA: PilW family protein [Kofleriaceae bacterium]|nr:PilW family protein [Kofleriaceae bacterium]